LPYRRVLAGPYQGERLARPLIEREPLDAGEREAATLRSVDDRLELLADLGHGSGIVDHLHAQAGLVHEVVERHDRP
jgi:hypothetical protein